MPTYSNSRISTFESCPLHYKYHYIDKIKPEQEDTVETFLGSWVHEALEKLYKDLKFEKLLSLKELLAHFNEKWNKNWNSNIKIIRKEYTKENYRKIGVRCLTEYYNRYQPFDQGKVLGLETTDMLNLDKEGKYKYHIRIDRLVDRGNGSYEVVDYKTSNSLPKQEYLDDDRQLAMYSLWVKKQFKDFKKVKLVWHFLAFDKRMESSRTLKQLEGLHNETLAKIEKIEMAKVFEPKESKLCNWCAYQDICPIWGHELKVEKKKVNEFLKDPGVKLVNKYVKTKQELKEFKDKAEEKLEKLKEALIEFCKREGVEIVIGSDNKISVKGYTSIKFPRKGTAEREKLVKLLKEIRKYNEVVCLDTFALDKIVKEEEWSREVLKKLEKFETKEKGYRLSVRKRRKEDA